MINVIRCALLVLVVVATVPSNVSQPQDTQPQDTQPQDTAQCTEVSNFKYGIDIAASIARIVTSIAIAIAAWCVHRLNVRNRTDLWVKHLADVNKEFWNHEDKDYAEVRSWLSCDSAFSKEVRSAFEKRQNPEKFGEMTPDDYEVIEKLDKFLNLLSSAILGASVLRPRPSDPAGQHLLPHLEYWLWLAVGGAAPRGKEPINDQTCPQPRKEITEYVTKRYERLYEYQNRG